MYGLFFCELVAEKQIVSVCSSWGGGGGGGGGVILHCSWCWSQWFGSSGWLQRKQKAQRSLFSKWWSQVQYQKHPTRLICYPESVKCLLRTSSLCRRLSAWWACTFMSPSSCHDAAAGPKGSHMLLPHRLVLSSTFLLLKDKTFLFSLAWKGEDLGCVRILRLQAAVNLWTQPLFLNLHLHYKKKCNSSPKTKQYFNLLTIVLYINCT